MKKRGQITTFIIISVVLLIVIVGVFFLRSSIIEEGGEKRISEVSSVPKQLESVKEGIKTCTDEFLEDSIYYLAAREGILDDNARSIDFGGFDVVYLIDESKRSLLPSSEAMSNSLSKFINENLNLMCDLEGAELGEVSSSVEIRDKEVMIVLNWPITLSKGDITGSIEQLSFDYNIRLGEMRDVVNELIKNQIKYHPKICLTCMAEIGVDNDALIERYIQDETQIFLIRDNTNDELIYTYAVNYG